MSLLVVKIEADVVDFDVADKVCVALHGVSWVGGEGLSYDAGYMSVSYSYTPRETCIKDLVWILFCGKLCADHPRSVGCVGHLAVWYRQAKSRYSMTVAAFHVLVVQDAILKVEAA